MPTRSNPARSRLERALEGRYLWGDFRVSTPGRTGWTSYRLTVYPPGTNAPERRALQFWYSWPVLGALICLIAFPSIGNRFGPAILIPASTVLYVGGLLLGWARTRRLRPRVVVLSVAQFAEAGGIQTLGDLTTLRAAVNRLDAMDAQRADGHLDELDYEHEWWSVYETVRAERVAS